MTPANVQDEGFTSVESSLIPSWHDLAERLLAGHTFTETEGLSSLVFPNDQLVELL